MEGQAMGNLPIWALWPITIAVWASPGLAILSARPLARMLHRMLWLRPEIAPQSVGQARGELAEARRSSPGPTAAIKAQ